MTNDEHTPWLYLQWILNSLQTRFPLVREAIFGLPEDIEFFENVYHTVAEEHIVTKIRRHYINPKLVYRDTSLGLTYIESGTEVTVRLTSIPEPGQEQVFRYVKDLVKTVIVEHDRLTAKFNDLNLAFLIASGTINHIES